MRWSEKNHQEAPTHLFCAALIPSVLSARLNYAYTMAAGGLMTSRAMLRYCNKKGYTLGGRLAANDEDTVLIPLS